MPTPTPTPTPAPTAYLLSRSGTERREGRWYTDVYEAICPGSYTANGVMQLASLPAIGDTYDGDGFSRCASIKPTMSPPTKDSGGHIRWEITVEYEPVTSTRTIEANPTDEWPLVEWDMQAYEEVADKDINGDPIRNSALDEFDPPLVEDRQIIVLRIVRNESAYSPLTARGYVNSTNSANITVCGITITAGDGLMKRYVGKPTSRNGTNFYEVTYEIHITDRDQRWKRSVLDQGLNQVVDGVRSRIKDDEGKDVTEPVRLDGTGAPLAFDAPASSSVWKVFDTKKTVAWAALSLPATVFKP